MMKADLSAILEQTRPLWEEMRGERIFFSGGTGFFGAWLTESFAYVNKELDLRARATVLSRNPEAFSRKCPSVTTDGSIEILRGDVRSFPFPEGSYRYAIHAATEASVVQATERPLDMLSTILTGTERMLEFAAASGAERFLLTSSGAVYGPQPSEMVHVPETYSGAPNPLEPASVYAEGKRTSELMCSLYSRQSNLKCSIARCWAFCGPHLPLDIHFAIGNFIRDALAGGPIRIGGDGTPTRSYLYAGDLAVWLWTMLFRGPAGVAYNVGSSESISILELAETVRDVLNPSIAIEVAKQAVPGAPVSRYVPSVEKAERELGLRQTVDLRETIRRTAAWYTR